MPHDILGLARHLRNDSGKIASPDYAFSYYGPYIHYFPYGYPTKISALTPPRTNLTSAGLKIGTGVKIHVDDTGLFAADPVNLPTTTQLTADDNDLVNRVNNGPLMIDFPAGGHGEEIDGVLTTVAPGSSIADVRINDRAGLATDVSAAGDRRLAALVDDSQLPQSARPVVRHCRVRQEPGDPGKPCCNQSAWKPSSKRSTGSIPSSRVAC